MDCALEPSRRSVDPQADCEPKRTFPIWQFNHQKMRRIKIPNTSFAISLLTHDEACSCTRATC